MWQTAMHNAILKSSLVSVVFWHFSYLAAVCSSLDVSSTHLVVSHSAVQVGWTIADLVLDHRETGFLQDAFASRTCNTPPCSYSPSSSSSSLSIIITGFPSMGEFWKKCFGNVRTFQFGHFFLRNNECVYQLVLHIQCTKSSVLACYQIFYYA